MSPTRELTTQIHLEARRFCYRTSLRPVVVYGGQDVRLQLRELDRGCDILVATPGRLVDLVERAKVSLADVSVLVFDEVCSVFFDECFLLVSDFERLMQFILHISLIVV